MPARRPRPGSPLAASDLAGSGDARLQDRIDALNRAAVGRRHLLTGAGAAALAAGGLVAGAGAAGAAVRPPARRTLPDRMLRRRDAVLPVSNASGPANGFAYRSVPAEAFFPIDPSVGRTYGEFGIYASFGDNIEMDSTLDLPGGTLVRDVEWYAFNGSGDDMSAYLLCWEPSTGYTLVVEGTIPTGIELSTTRMVVATADRGPYESGAVLIPLWYSFEDGSIQVQGVRIGLSQGSGQVGLLPAPVRAYDSRSTGGKLSAGVTRTITLPSAIVPPGSNAVLVNVTVTQGEAGGYVKVWPGGAAQPTSSSINFATGQTVANALTVGVSSDRQINVFANKAVHIVLDVTGSVS